MLTRIVPAVAIGVLITMLPACATLETAADHTRDFVTAHPVLTSVVAGVAAGAIVAAVDHHHRDHPQELSRLPVRHDLDIRSQAEDLP